MELHDITAELRDASQRLSKGATGLFKLAEASAYAEQEYRKALAHEILRLEQEGKRDASLRKYLIGPTGQVGGGCLIWLRRTLRELR